MVTAQKISIASRWFWNGKNFARSSPGESQNSSVKCSLLYKQARYYNDKKGLFVSEDPLGFVDGYSLYRLYSLIIGRDPEGTECTVCNKGRIHYGAHARFLDFPVNGTPYQRGLNAWAARWRRGTKHNGDLFGGLTIPNITQAGPVKYATPIVDIPGRWPKKDSYGLSAYPFFVDFDVCNPEDCIVEVFEHGERRDLIGEEDWTEWKTIKGPGALVLSSPPWAANLTVNKKRFLFNPCSHRIVLTDMPGIEQFVFKNTKEQNRVDSDVFISQLRANQKVQIRDKVSGKVVSSIEHDFLIGLDKDGNLVHEP